VADRRVYRFPHLLPEDALTWGTWLKFYGDALSIIDYDVRVGLGRPVTDDHTPEIQKMALDLSMRRIDAIGHTPDHNYIFEVASSAGFTTVGQCFAYPVLYKQTFSPATPTEMILIASEIQSDIRAILEYYKIPTYLVESPQNPPALQFGTITGSLGVWTASTSRSSKAR
jgi:hypothetical protein